MKNFSSDFLRVCENPDNATNSRDCKHLVMPDQEPCTAILCRLLEAPVDELHEHTPRLAVQLLHQVVTLKVLEGK